MFGHTVLQNEEAHTRPGGPECWVRPPCFTWLQFYVKHFKKFCYLRVEMVTCQPHVLSVVIIIKPKVLLCQVSVSVMRVKDGWVWSCFDNIYESFLEFPGVSMDIFFFYCFSRLWICSCLCLSCFSVYPAIVYPSGYSNWCLLCCGASLRLSFGFSITFLLS